MFKYISFINSFVAFLLGTFVFSSNYKSKSNLYFFLLSLAISIHFILLPLSIYEPTISTSLIEVRFVHVCSTFIATFFYLFTCEILFGNTFRKISHYISIICALVATYFTIFGDVISKVEPIGILPNWTVPGTHFFIYLINFAFYTTFSMYLLIRFRNNVEQNKRKALNLYFLGMGLGLLAGWTAFLPGFGIKIEPYGLFFIFVFQFMVGYAILKYQMFDIKIVLSQFGSTIISTLICSLFSILALYFSTLFTDFANINITSMIVSISIGFMSGISFLKLGTFLFTTAKQNFIKGYYDPEELFNHISLKLKDFKSKKDIIECLLQEIDEGIHLQELGSMIIDSDSKDKTYHLKYESKTKKFKLSPKIHAYLLSRQEFLEAKELPEHIQIELKDWEIPLESVLIPICTYNQVEGILILGQKSSGKTYDQRDIGFFNTLINLTSAILYKMTPLEIIREEFLKNQKRLHDSEIQLIRTKKMESLLHTTRQFQHEIRTPLGIINANLSQFDKDMISKKDFLETVKHEIKRAVTILNETLTISDASRPTPKREIWVDIHSTIKRSLKLVSESGFTMM